MNAFSYQSTDHHVRSFNKHAIEDVVLFAQSALIPKTELVENWGNEQASYNSHANFVNKLIVIKQIIVETTAVASRLVVGFISIEFQTWLRGDVLFHAPCGYVRKSIQCSIPNSFI